MGARTEAVETGLGGRPLDFQMSMPMTQCPVCGGDVHPIAGRCKHCKTDLVALRAEQARQAQYAAQQAAAAQPTAAAAQAIPRPPTSPAAGSAPHAVAGNSAPHALAAVPGSAPTAAPAPAMMYQRPASTWSRRWPYIVAAFAVVAIVASLVVMIQRWSADPKSEATDPAASAAPADNATKPPDDKGPAAKTTPPPPSAPKGVTPPSSPRSSHKAPPPGRFAVALTERVCAKLESCGMLTSFSKMMCADLANQLGDPDAADKVKRGECTYDSASAAKCLGAIDDLSCTTQSQDVMAWVTKAGALAECASAYVCN